MNTTKETSKPWFDFKFIVINTSFLLFATYSFGTGFKFGQYFCFAWIIWCAMVSWLGVFALTKYENILKDNPYLITQLDNLIEYFTIYKFIFAVLFDLYMVVLLGYHNWMFTAWICILMIWIDAMMYYMVRQYQ